MIDAPEYVHVRWEIMDRKVKDIKRQLDDAHTWGTPTYLESLRQNLAELRGQVAAAEHAVWHIQNEGVQRDGGMERP